MKKMPTYIDIHVHANACTDEGFTLDSVVEWMDENRVERCIIQQLKQTLPRNAEEDATQVRNYRKHRGRIYGFCVSYAKDVISLEQTARFLRREKQKGAIGFGEHYGEGLFVNDPKSMILYEACAEVGLPVLFHMDGENNRDEPGLPLLEEVLKAVPDCTFIAHAPGWWTQLPSGTCERLLQNYPNLYGDLSAGSGARAISRDKDLGREFLIRNADKLLFGTDSGPWSYGKAPAPQFALFEELALPADVKRKICRKNAERLFAFGVDCDE
jgi:uncharacterized protein